MAEHKDVMASAPIGVREQFKNGYVTIPLDTYNKLLDNQITSIMRIDKPTYSDTIHISFDGLALYETAIAMFSKHFGVDPAGYDVKHYNDVYIPEIAIAKERPADSKQVTFDLDKGEVVEATDKAGDK